MATNAIRWALYEAPKIKAEERVVLIALGDHAAQDGGGNFISTSSLARKLHMGVRAVERCLIQLERQGIICLAGGSPPVVVQLNLEVRERAG